MTEKMSMEDDLSIEEEARSLYPTLHEILMYEPLIDANLPVDPEDSRHLLISKETLEKFAPDLVKKFEEVSKARPIPENLVIAGLEERPLPRRQIDDQFNPFRKNKIFAILSPVERITMVLNDPDLNTKAIGLMQTFKLSFLTTGKADVTKDFARTVYEFGKKVDQAYREHEGLDKE